MISVYRKILELLDRRERRHFYMLLGLIMVMGLFDMLGVATILPFLAVVTNPSLIETNTLISTLYSILQPESDQAFLIILGAIVFATLMLGLGIKITTIYAIARFGQMRKYNLSNRLLVGYLRQPYVWFLSRNTSALTKQVLSEVNEVVGKSLMPAMTMLAQIVSLAFMVGLLLVVQPQVAITAALVIGGVYVFIFLVLRRALLRLGQARYTANRERYRITSELLGGIKEVKLAGLEQPYLGRFRTPNRQMAESEILERVVSELPRYLLEAIAFGGMVVIVLVMLSRGGDLDEALPILGLFAAASLRMFPAVQKLYGSLSTMKGGTAVLDAIHAEVIALKNNGRQLSNPAGITPLQLSDRLELHNVSYQYPTAGGPALREMDMQIPARSTVGIVGGTGAGKTTTVDLILGLLTPDKGSVLVDGDPVCEKNMRAWQNNIGYVPQQIYLIDDTIAANIALGIRPEVRDSEKVERAAKLAELHSFVTSELPLGYETVVGERGVRLSGGQKQRIGIARALYTDPDVLILDEATSALDNLTERAVMDAVRNLSNAKTIIMIAHRLTTVRHCDKIFLMENGRVADTGTYDDLVSKSSRFREMAQVV